jgi:hypothetical protein
MTTCLVGKLPKAARQDCWPLFGLGRAVKATKRRVDWASSAMEHHVIVPGRIRPEGVA